MWACAYLGPKGADEAEADAKAFGLDPALFQRPAPQDEGIWDIHLPALEAFLLVCHQWRVWGGGGRPWFLGLDYAAVRAGFDLAGVQVTPALWAQIAQIEWGALQELNAGEGG